MNKGAFWACIALVLAFAACSPDRRVLVMVSGKVQISGNTVNLSPGTTHNEERFTPTGDKITVVAPEGAVTHELPEPGLYILNLKKDTIIGAYQRTGKDQTEQFVSQEELRFRIDSLYKLMHGWNVSPEARNFNIPPSGIAHITKNTKAEVIGPYQHMPTAFSPDREHEVYKVYTGKEVQEIILRLLKMVDRRALNRQQDQP